jgi:hypothetical protein
MAPIDRTCFEPDSQTPGLRGSFTISGRKYEGFLNTWTGDMERTWAQLERIATFLETRFAEIEATIRTKLIPDLELWLDGDDQADTNELEQRVLEAMRTTDPVGFTIYDDGASSIYFNGPDFVEGHTVEVQFDEQGRLACVGLAG